MEKATILAKSFDLATGFETIRFRWPSDVLTSFGYICRYPDVDKQLPIAAAQILGRSFDLDRNPRIKQIELQPTGPVITLEFDPPWWWGQVTATWPREESTPASV